MSQALEIAAKLYEIRDVIRDLAGQEYGRRMGPIVFELRKQAVITRRPVLLVAKQAAEQATRKGDRVVAMCILAAAVEAVEEPLPPSPFPFPPCPEGV